MVCALCIVHLGPRREEDMAGEGGSLNSEKQVGEIAATERSGTETE